MHNYYAIPGNGPIRTRGASVTELPTITPGVKSGVPFQFGTRYGPIRTRGARGHGVMPGAGTFLRYGPIRTRGARGHGVMPGAGTFLHRFDQSERAIVFLIFTPGALAFWDAGTAHFLFSLASATTQPRHVFPCVSVVFTRIG